MIPKEKILKIVKASAKKATLFVVIGVSALSILHLIIGDITLSYFWKALLNFSLAGLGLFAIMIIVRILLLRNNDNSE